MEEPTMTVLMRHCNQCGHIWRPRIPAAPKACPKCQSARWHELPKSPQQIYGQPPEALSNVIDHRAMGAIQGIPGIYAAATDAVAALAYLSETIDAYRVKIAKALAEASGVREGLVFLMSETEPLRRRSQGKLTRLPEDQAQPEALPPGPGEQIPQQTHQEAARATSTDFDLSANTPALAPQLRQEMQLELQKPEPKAKPEARIPKPASKPRPASARGRKSQHKPGSPKRRPLG